MGLQAVIIKELRQFFGTPIAYVVTAVFWIASGYFFSFNIFYVSAVHMVTTFHNMTILLLLMVPLVTMRALSEERSSGTIEILSVLPLSSFQLVLGKYIGVLIVMLLMIVGTGISVGLLAFFAEPDMGPILGGYVGIVLMVTMCSALGVMVSSACSNQIVAATLTWGVLLLLWFVDYGTGLTEGTSLATVLHHLSLSLHMRDAIRGILDLQMVVYCGSWTVISLTCARQFLRWNRS